MKPFQLPLFCIALATVACAEHPVLDSARRALDEQIPELALARLTFALKSPDFPTADREAASFLVAEAQLRTGKAADALVVLERLTGKNAALLRAHAMAAEGRWSEALPLYDDIAGVHGVPISATIGKAESLQMLGRTAEAVAVFEKLIADGKAPVSARLRHAGWLTELGRKGEAAELLRSIEVVKPSDARWRDYASARLLLANEQWQPALDALDKITPESEGVSSHLLAAVVLASTEAKLKLKNIGSEGAARALEKFLWDQPNNPAIEMIFRRLDQINAGERSPREAELHKMADTDEQVANPRRAALAQFYVSRMQWREKSRKHLAEKSLRLFLVWFPNHRLTTYVHEMLAEVAQSAGAFDDALRSLEAAQRTAQDRDRSALPAASGVCPERVAQEKERSALLEMRMALVGFQKGDAALAVTYFRLAAEHSVRLQKSAAFNAALAELELKNLDGFQKRLAEFVANHGSDPLTGELVLESGVTEARVKPSSAPATLRAFLSDYPGHPRRGEAFLVLAELQLAGGNPVEAEVELSGAKATEGTDATGGQTERNRYAAIFIADAAKPRDSAKVIALGRAFIEEHPISSLLPDVRMKLGQVYFHDSDFANAQTQFETLAREQPESAYAETALFLAGQCAIKLMDPNSADRATALFAQVVERKGALKYHAYFQQAIIQHELDKDASAIFQTILDAQPPAPSELRHASLCAKGDNLVRIAKGAPEKLGVAIEAYIRLKAMPDVSPEWHNKAVYKQGNVLLKLGREQEALFIYSDLLDKAMTGPKETFWLYKAGFEAAGILEGFGSWRDALATYEKLGKIPGPRAAEARAKVKEIRLKKFIWN